MTATTAAELIQQARAEERERCIKIIAEIAETQTRGGMLGARAMEKLIEAIEAIRVVAD